MTRVKRSVHAKKRKRAYFKAAKGYRGGRRNLLRTVKDAVERSREYAYRDRKTKKRDFRRIWITRINAAVRQYGLSYSKFMNQLSKANVELNRKTLAFLAYNEPETFKVIVDQVKSA